MWRWILQYYIFQKALKKQLRLTLWLTVQSAVTRFQKKYPNFRSREELSDLISYKPKTATSARSVDSDIFKESSERIIYESDWIGSRGSHKVTHWTVNRLLHTVCLITKNSCILSLTHTKTFSAKRYTFILALWIQIIQCRMSRTLCDALREDAKESLNRFCEPVL